MLSFNTYSYRKTGFPMKFSTEGEAIKFLSKLGIEEATSLETGEIRIDRVH